MESEEKLCVKVLRTLQQMLLKKNKYGDRVSDWGDRDTDRLANAGLTTAPHPHLPPGQPAAQDAAAELPPEPEVQLERGPLRPRGHWSVLPAPARLPWPLLPGLGPSSSVPPFQAWTKTGQRLGPPSAGWTRRGPPSWCATSSPAPRMRRSSRRALAWPSACWTGATLRSRCGLRGCELPGGTSCSGGVGRGCRPPSLPCAAQPLVPGSGLPPPEVLPTL